MARLDSVLLAAVAALAGALAASRPWHVVVVVVVACVAAVLAGRTASRIAVTVALLAFAIGCLRVRRAFEAERVEAARAAIALPRPARCELFGEVVSMPRKRGVVAADVQLSTLACDGVPLEAAGLRAHLYDLPDDVARGDRVEIVAQLARARRIDVPELGDPRPMRARRGYAFSGGALLAVVDQRAFGVRPAIDRLRTRLRRGLDAVMPVDVAPIARALVLGEEDLADADDEAFRRSGLTHLLAVSGSHVALVVGSIVAALRAAILLFPRVARRCEPARVAALAGVPLACVYEQLAGDSGSARRATAMAVVVLLVRASGRRADTVRTLAASTLAALAIDPLAPFDLSFALSLAATLGLISLARPATRLCERVPLLPRAISRALATTLAASVACAPLIAGLSGSLPLVGVVANVVAVPIGELAALPLCNVAALLGMLSDVPFAGAVARLAGSAAGGAIVLLRGVAAKSSAPTWAVARVPPPSAAQLAVLSAAIAVAYVRPRTRAGNLALASATAAALLLLELWNVRLGAPRGQLRVTVLDIGQGDSSIVDLPDGKVMLVDGGGEVGSPWDPGRVVVAPVLDARRRDRIDVAVLTHPHPDHFLGLRHALATRAVSALWDTGEGAGGELGLFYAALRARGVPIVRPAELCGAHAIGGATIEVLHPCPGFDPDWHTNDNSFVMRIGFGARHALLVGDAEHEAEAALLARGVELGADFLKVGHHGSRTSSGARFLEAVHPAIAAISCGIRNRFGHPHAPSLQRLAASGARVLRTDLVGAIRWTTDGASMSVATAQEGW